MKDRYGILIISFGTSFDDAAERAIFPVVEEVRKEWPDYEVRLAYSSRIIRTELSGRGIQVPSPEEAAADLAAEGCTHLMVQPLHFMQGHEYHRKIVAPLQKYRERFTCLTIGEPLLTGPEDYATVARHIAGISSELQNELLLLMGHGSSHEADTVYTNLQDALNRKGTNALIATVEGSVSLQDLLPSLRNKQPRCIHLVPLMLVAGDHARNDMAGEKDSWKSRLESSGYNVTAHLTGMGEYKAVRDLFIAHIRAKIAARR
jgi:sirohydrochlorin cobaltochelatase